MMSFLPSLYTVRFQTYFTMKDVRRNRIYSWDILRLKYVIRILLEYFRPLGLSISLGPSLIWYLIVLCSVAILYERYRWEADGPGVNTDGTLLSPNLQTRWLFIIGFVFQIQDSGTTQTLCKVREHSSTVHRLRPLIFKSEVGSAAPTFRNAYRPIFNRRHRYRCQNHPFDLQGSQDRKSVV